MRASEVVADACNDGGRCQQWQKHTPAANTQFPTLRAPRRSLSHSPQPLSPGQSTPTHPVTTPSLSTAAARPYEVNWACARLQAAAIWPCSQFSSATVCPVCPSNCPCGKPRARATACSPNGLACWRSALRDASSPPRSWQKEAAPTIHIKERWRGYRNRNLKDMLAESVTSHCEGHRLASLISTIWRLSVYKQPRSYCLRSQSFIVNKHSAFWQQIW